MPFSSILCDDNDDDDEVDVIVINIIFLTSNFEGDIETLEVGHEVEFQICNKAGRVSAECIRRIANKSIQIGVSATVVIVTMVMKGEVGVDFITNLVGLQKKSVLF